MANINKSQDLCNNSLNELQDIAGSYYFNGANLTPCSELQKPLVVFKNPKKGINQRPFKIRFADSQKTFSGLRYTDPSLTDLEFNITLETGEKLQYILSVTDCKTKANIKHVQDI